MRRRRFWKWWEDELEFDVESRRAKPLQTKTRVVISWAVLILIFSTAVVLFVYRVARLPLLVALLFPLLMYGVGGLLNVIGTLLGKRDERRRSPESRNHR